MFGHLQNSCRYNYDGQIIFNVNDPGIEKTMKFFVVAAIQLINIADESANEISTRSKLY